MLASAQNWRVRASSASTATFCGDHKEAGMVDLKSKRCEMCAKGPSFNMEGES